MACNVSNLDFVFIGYKFTGLFTEYPNVIPDCLRETMHNEQLILNRVDKTLILYEPCKGEDHKIGYFYIGWIVTEEQSILPNQAHLIRVKGKYVTSSGTIEQMEEIYARINHRIHEKAYTPIWPDTLYIEIYDEPLNPEVTLKEEVQVYLPIK